MIDVDGFRPNVGIILANAAGCVLWAKRVGQDAWQFPQGGIKRGEEPEQALFRELEEELGLKPEHVQPLAVTEGWRHYRLPSRLVRRRKHPICIGQKQKWFLLRMLAPDASVRLDACDHPEFDGWRWVDWWQPLNEVVEFKRDVYRAALNQLAPLAGLAPRVSGLPPAQPLAASAA